MYIFIRLFVCLFFIAISFVNVSAQQVSLSAGGNISGSNGSISYSIGQMAYVEIPGINGSIIHGVQQPIEISVVNEIKTNSLADHFVQVYPNPIKSSFQLLLNHDELDDITYQIFDAQGTLIVCRNVTNVKTVINLDSYPAATYLLTINKNSKLLETIKIIKQ